MGAQACPKLVRSGRSQLVRSGRPGPTLVGPYLLEGATSGSNHHEKILCRSLTMPGDGLCGFSRAVDDAATSGHVPGDRPRPSSI